jgi:hypothetical protein
VISKNGLKFYKKVPSPNGRTDFGTVGVGRTLTPCSFQEKSQTLNYWVFSGLDSSPKSKFCRFHGVSKFSAAIHPNADVKGLNESSLGALKNIKNFLSIGYLGPENDEFMYRGVYIFEIPVVPEHF